MSLENLQLPRIVIWEKTTGKEKYSKARRRTRMVNLVNVFDSTDITIGKTMSMLGNKMGYKKCSKALCFVDITGFAERYNWS